MAAVCSFFLQGRCRNGDACRFSHDATPAAPGANESGATAPIAALASSLGGVAIATADTRPPCSFFAQGRCRNGDACRFSHTAPAPAAPTAPAALAAPAAPAPPPTAALNLTTDPKLLYSIDVECVATGMGHHDRSVAQIGLVDAESAKVLNLYIKPIKPAHGTTLEEALVTLRAALPKHAYLVGQNIRKDTEWLELEEGVDFAGCIDLAGLTRVYNPKYSSYTHFGLDHVATAWLGEALGEGEAHDALGDAAKSMRVYRKYLQVSGADGGGAAQGALGEAQQLLLRAPKAPSFAVQNPTFDGVCQGNRKTCKCGQPFFS